MMDEFTEAQLREKLESLCLKVREAVERQCAAARDNVGDYAGLCLQLGYVAHDLLSAVKDAEENLL